MKNDEQELLNAIHDKARTGENPYVRGIVRELGMNEKRAAYICEKWTKKGWYDWGVSVLAGWLTDAAPNAELRPTGAGLSRQVEP
jgi:hypothetical protein